eukprot:GFKZ01002489.1.p1 GENE.GFKZ01002489.1~~GFKZ01002489.1.p1  ORF type:complete len:109 (+),score=7.48 GFKZ01002489.1:39-365(+)
MRRIPLLQRPLGGMTPGQKGWRAGAPRCPQVEIQAKEQVIDFIVNAYSCCLEKMRAEYFDYGIVAIFPANALGVEIGGVVAEMIHRCMTLGALQKRSVIEYGNTEMAP